MLVQIPNSHSLGLKTVNYYVTEMEIGSMGSPEQSSLLLIRSLKHLHYSKWKGESNGVKFVRMKEFE